MTISCLSWIEIDNHPYNLEAPDNLKLNMSTKSFKLKGVGTPREAPKNVFWDVSVFSSDSGREMIAFASSKH